jgi:uridine kinase
MSPTDPRARHVGAAHSPSSPVVAAVPQAVPLRAGGRRPSLVIGVAGGTGSGKTTIARKLAAAMPAGTSTIIEFDSYYRDLGGEPIEALEARNYDHPDALESALLAEHIRRLRQGEPVDVPIYDFRTHARLRETRRIEPVPVVVVEGILALALPEVRQHFDIKIFVDTDADIRVFRRIRRDLDERGRTFASVREQYYKSVRPMHHQFVEPSKQWADLIIPEGGNNQVALEILVARLLQAAAAG